MPHTRAHTHNKRINVGRKTTSAASKWGFRGWAVASVTPNSLNPPLSFYSSLPSSLLSGLSSRTPRPGFHVSCLTILRDCHLIRMRLLVSSGQWKELADGVTVWYTPQTPNPDLSLCQNPFLVVLSLCFYPSWKLEWPHKLSLGKILPYPGAMRLLAFL